MVARIKARVWMSASVLVAGLAAAVAFRSLVVAGVTMLLASLSGVAVASVSSAAGGKAGAAAAGIHAPAVVGALMGALLQLLQLKTRPLPERVIITLVSFVAAYFGGLAAVETWPHLGGGSVGVAGTACAYIVVPTLDALRVLLGDVLATLRGLLADLPWIKRLVGARMGVADDPADRG